MNLRLDFCSHKAAKYAVERWHYSKTMPKSKIVKIGIWENEIYIGCIIYGVGANRSLVTRYGLQPEQGCELVRIALNKHSLPVTKYMSISIRMIKKLCPGLRIIVSFADPEKGHHGGIYQGGNWVYTGRTVASDEYIYRGKRWQGRSFRNSFKGMENHPYVKIVKGSSKYRYLMPLDKKIRERVEKSRKPYPKRATSKDVVAPSYQPGEGGSIPTVALSNTEAT